MMHCNTILAQFLRLISRPEFERLSWDHHQGRAFRTASRWSQFVALVIGQLTGRASLRDLVSSLSARRTQLKQLGCGPLSRSNLARINETKPYRLYRALFHQLLGACLRAVPGHRFRFKSPLYSLDASVIELCWTLFPWAECDENRSALKLHVGLNHSGGIPEFVHMTHARQADVTVGRRVRFSPGSVVVFDRGYIDYAWYKRLTDRGIYFVTRLKRGTCYRVTERREVLSNKGLTCDQSIRLNGQANGSKVPRRAASNRLSGSGNGETLCVFDQPL